MLSNFELGERDQWSWKLAILVTHIVNWNKKNCVFISVFLFRSQDRKKTRIFSFYQHLFSFAVETNQNDGPLWEIIQLNCLVGTQWNCPETTQLNEKEQRIGCETNQKYLKSESVSI